MALHPLLSTIVANEPGRYLTEGERRQLLADDPSFASRVRAAIAAEAKQSEVLKAVVEPVLKKFDYRKSHDFAEDKCYRDVGNVYRWCVFAMVCDDVSLLENKLLFWLRTILQSFQFPGHRESIGMTYTALRKEVARRLPEADAKLLDPFFERAESILPS